MTLSVQQSEVPQKLAAIEQARQTAVQALQGIQAIHQGMLQPGSGTWQGGSATNYGNLSATQHDDITQIMANLNHIVDTVEGQLKNVGNLDNG